MNERLVKYLSELSNNELMYANEYIKYSMLPFIYAKPDYHTCKVSRQRALQIIRTIDELTYGGN